MIIIKTSTFAKLIGATHPILRGAHFSSLLTSGGLGGAWSTPSGVWGQRPHEKNISLKLGEKVLPDGK
jgi:hypothetical protein